jgi:glycosyltransferase involved in cell wall biosynthesis
MSVVKFKGRSARTEMLNAKLLVIVVTYNSQKFIDWALAPLLDRELCHVRVVDSGSSDVTICKLKKIPMSKSYLKKFRVCKSQ